MLRLVTLSMLFMAWLVPAQAANFEDTVAAWTSPEDVGAWLKDNFKFDTKRLKIIQKRLRQSGPSGLLVRAPVSTFEHAEGYCADAAYFSLVALNKINPEYNARWIFVKNARGKPNHWVTGFTMDGKLYVMDYGAGPHWKQMIGLHGPYETLDGYADFLASLRIKSFAVGEVKWRQMPGTYD